LVRSNLAAFGQTTPPPTRASNLNKWQKPELYGSCNIVTLLRCTEHTGFRTARALCPAPPEAFGHDPDRAAVDDETPGSTGLAWPIVVTSDGLVEAVSQA
jgi:hypothetical protein